MIEGDSRRERETKKEEKKWKKRRRKESLLCDESLHFGNALLWPLEQEGRPPSVGQLCVWQKHSYALMQQLHPRVKRHLQPPCSALAAPAS